MQQIYREKDPLQSRGEAKNSKIQSLLQSGRFLVPLTGLFPLP